MRISSKTENKFGIKIRELRMNKKLSQLDMCDKMEQKGIDMDNASLSLIESGSRRPNWDTLNKFAQFFEVDVKYFL